LKTSRFEQIGCFRVLPVQCLLTFPNLLTRSIRLFPSRPLIQALYQLEPMILFNHFVVSANVLTGWL